jgi:phospholipid/cholesterol/gamma-HCH transport system substrate-binding protein
MKISREIKIGFFATLCLAAMFWGINFLKGKNVFSPNNTYYTIFSSVDGLKNTNNVLINGFKVGLVKNIEFAQNSTGKFLVTLLIGKQYAIPRNTVAKLISSDIMGGKAIKLDVSHDTLYYQPFDTLPSSIETGLIDQLGHQMVPVKEKAEKLMEEMDKTLKVFAEVFNESNREHLNQSFLNINQSLLNINRTTAALDTMLNQPNGSLRNIFLNVESISGNLKKNNKELTNIIKNFSSLSDTLAKIHVAQTLMQVDTALHQFNTILGKVNSGHGTLGNLVNNDTLYYNLESAAHNLDLLLKDVKANPRRYISFSVIDLSRTKYIEEKKPKSK